MDGTVSDGDTIVAGLSGHSFMVALKDNGCWGTSCTSLSKPFTGKLKPPGVFFSKFCLSCAEREGIIYSELNNT